MAVLEVRYQGIRNLQAGDLTPASRLNWLYGPNGAGKSSLLETLFLLGHGRSFRTSTIERVISDGSEALTAFARVESAGSEVRLGLSRSRKGEITLRVNGGDEKRLSALACHLPVQILTPDSSRLLTEGPRERRRFIDWGVFHVEHGFASVAQRYARALQQRNQLLKQQAPVSLLEPWNQQLVDWGLQMAAFRERHVAGLIPLIRERWQRLLPDLDVQWDWYSGWAGELSLAEALSANLGRDREAGATQAGPHRADLRIRIGRVAAAEVLSRGQGKLLVQCLHLAQMQAVTAGGAPPGVLLFDDLGAELDDQRQADFLEAALSLPGLQVFATSTLPGPKAVLERYNGAMFHVEHGQLSRVSRHPHD